MLFFFVTNNLWKFLLSLNETTDHRKSARHAPNPLPFFRNEARWLNHVVKFAASQCSKDFLLLATPPSVVEMICDWLHLPYQHKHHHSHSKHRHSHWTTTPIISQRKHGYDCTSHDPFMTQLKHFPGHKSQKYWLICRGIQLGLSLLAHGSKDRPLIYEVRSFMESICEALSLTLLYLPKMSYLIIYLFIPFI